MKTLTLERIKADNPHFIENPERTYFTMGDHKCCDARGLAKDFYGTIRKATASYEFYDGNWHLIAS